MSFGTDKIKLIKGDITKIKADIIVNAANASLLGGDGVDGAIHKAGGPSILAECMKIRERQGGCKTGNAVITGPGNLNAQYIVHTVGPVWKGGNFDEDKLLANCYRNCMRIARDLEVKTIAFPCISTGAFGYPNELAARIALHEVSNFIKKNDYFEQIIFVCFTEYDYNIYKRTI